MNLRRRSLSRRGRPAMATAGRPDIANFDVSQTLHEEVSAALGAAESREPVAIDRPERYPCDGKGSRTGTYTDTFQGNADASCHWQIEKKSSPQKAFPMAIILPGGIASAHVFPVHSENAFARGAGVVEMAPKRVTWQQSMHVNRKIRCPVAFDQSRSSPNQFETPCEISGAMIVASNEKIDPANRL